jgi:hypothetical protein
MKQPTKDAAALERTRADLKAAFEETDRLAAEKRQLESQLAGRFVEMIALTRIAQRAEDERDAAVADRNAAIADRDAAVAEGNNALAQASAMKAELDDALLKHASEIAGPASGRGRRGQAGGRTPCPVGPDRRRTIRALALAAGPDAGFGPVAAGAADRPARP